MKLKAGMAAAVLCAVLCGCAGGVPAENITAPAAVTVVSIVESEPEAVHGKTAVTETGVSMRDLLECRYYFARDFTVYEKRASVYETGGGVLCGVAPHHLTAGHLIAGMYAAAANSGRDIDTVVLVAPQHYPGNDPLVTSEKGWSTPFGVSPADTDIAHTLCSELGARTDDEMIQYDHSASSHIPFISYYLPDTKITCLLVSPDAGRDFPERFAVTAARIAAEKNVLFAFSIDFSHYLDPDEADKHDAETLAAVLAGDTDTIADFGNSNVDTPLGLSAYVELSRRLGGTVKAADNANTYTVGDLPYNRAIFPEGVTSYFVFLTEQAPDGAAAGKEQA